jgi:hypothetical protein
MGTPHRQLDVSESGEVGAISHDRGLNGAADARAIVCQCALSLIGHRILPGYNVGAARKE